MTKRTCVWLIGILLLLLVATLLSACGGPTAPAVAPTAVPPTSAPPPSDTPQPASTTMPPTDTPMPTATPVPPTNTAAPTNIPAPTAAPAPNTTGLVYQSFLGGQLRLAVPPEFTVMDEAMLRLKYPSERRPPLVLTNAAGSVNIAVNHTQNAMTESQVVSRHAAMEKVIKNLYPSATWFRSEVTKINGRAAFILDLRSPTVDTEVRNIMMATFLDNRMLLVSFNCTKELESEWEPIGQRVIASAVVAP